MNTSSVTAAAQLRIETRAEHERTEQALSWRSRVASRETYRHWLLGLHGFHRTWEPAVAAALAAPEFFDPHRKLCLLTADLLELGASESEIAAAPSFSAPMPFTTRAEALGSMYVIEGSMLGGRFISRRVQSALNFSPRYHSGYGSAGATMWQSFQQSLDRHVATAELEGAVGSAKRTFEAIRRWLTSAESK